MTEARKRAIRPGQIETLIRSLADRYLKLGVKICDLPEMLAGDAQLQLQLGCFKIHPHHVLEMEKLAAQVIQELGA